jgi:hypothetical protein
VLLNLVLAVQHQPDLFATDSHRASETVAAGRPHQGPLRPLRNRFGLFPPDVRAFKGHAAFHRVPESWEF